MAEVRGSKNLGLIKAIHVGTNPPLNVRMIWFDDNIGVKIHKRYNFQTSTWVPLGGDSSTIVNGIYTYLGYAEDCDGANFSLTKTPTSTHFAIITSPTLIALVEASLFTGRWAPYCDGLTTGGNYTYIRYATDCEGADFGLTPTFDTPCGDCKPVDSFNLIKRNNTINATILGDELTIDFTNCILGQFILLELKMDGNNLENLVSYFIQSTRSATFSGGVKIQFDTNLPTFRTVNQATSVNEEYYEVINGSRLYIEVNELAPATTLTGQIVFKIGTQGCDPVYQTNCKGCRDYVAFLSSDTPMEPGDITVDLFEGLWMGFNNCGSCGTPADNSQIYEQLNYLFNLHQTDITNQAIINASINTLITNLTNSTNASIDDLQQQITDLSNFVNDGLDDVNDLINDLSQLVQSNFDSLTISIQSALDLAIAHSDSVDEGQNILLESLLESVINLQIRVTNLEGGAFSQSLTGTIDGVNTLFTTDHVFLGGTTRVYVNGVRQKLGIDYTEEVGNQSINFTVAPVAAPALDILTIEYLKDL